mgnify:CR=1 FL=1
MRFPEFSGEWERCKVKDFTKVVAGATPSTSNKEYWGGDIRWMNSGELNLKRVYEVQGRITQLGYEKTSTKIIPPQSVLIGLAGQGKTRGTAAINYVELCTNQSIASILPSDKYYPEFLYQNIESRYKELRDISSGDGGRGGLNLQMIYNLNIPYCSISEQRKIGDFLCLLDQRIETQRKIIKKYESLIRGLISDVNNGKICLCKSVFLRDILTERHEKNMCNHEVCSVSVSHGVINQVDYLGRSFAAKEVLHYNVVNYGDIIYTKSPTGDFPYGIVKRSKLEKPVAVSPLYGVYRPVNDIIGKYLHLYFKSSANTKNYLHKLIQKGAKNTINITNQHFLDNKILIPDGDWLYSIVSFAGAIEQKIKIENSSLSMLEYQKNYLLSRLFI